MWPLLSLTTFHVPLSSLSSHRRELLPPQMGCPFQAGNSTRCKLFSRMPSTDGITHPIWGALLSPATRPCHGLKRAPLSTFHRQWGPSNSKPSASNACPSVLSPAHFCPQQCIMHPMWSAVLSPFNAYPQQSVLSPASNLERARPSNAKLARNCNLFSFLLSSIR